MFLKFNTKNPGNILKTFEQQTFTPYNENIFCLNMKIEKLFFSFTFSQNSPLISAVNDVKTKFYEIY